LRGEKGVNDKMKQALITGITGQDGAYLASLLLKKGYKVYGTYRRISSPNFWRLQYLDIYDKIYLIPVELIDTGSLAEAISISNPDEIYHLAAQSFVGASFETPLATSNTTGLAATRILEVIRQNCDDAKFYFAASSEMFGKTGSLVSRPLRENDYFHPLSPYASAKLYGYWITKIYREGYGLFTVNGILFNHESPIRGLEFLTRKVVNEVAKISLGLSKELRLGNMSAKRDWGYAPEYVESMWRMLQQKNADDYIIATGNTYSVKSFVKKSFEYVGLDYEKYVKVDKQYFRPLDVPCLVGDSTKAKKILNWSPKIQIDQLIKIMVDEDIMRWQKWLNGDRFPWDAPNFPNDKNMLSRALRG